MNGGDGVCAVSAPAPSRPAKAKPTRRSRSPEIQSGDSHRSLSPHSKTSRQFLCVSAAGRPSNDMPYVSPDALLSPRPTVKCKDSIPFPLDPYSFRLDSHLLVTHSHQRLTNRNEILHCTYADYREH